MRHQEQTLPLPPNTRPGAQVHTEHPYSPQNRPGLLAQEGGWDSKEGNRLHLFLSEGHSAQDPLDGGQRGAPRVDCWTSVQNQADFLFQDLLTHL